MERMIRSLGHAWRGVRYVFRHERNARIHLVFCLLVFIMGVYVGLSAVELAAIFFAVVVVFVAEITNTAIEKTLDLVEPGHHPQVGLVKDMAAGAVLVAAAAAVAIGVVIFTPYLVELWLK
jgi:diacylglycerol kinase